MLNKARSGTLRVTWAVCPNKECASRDWEVWSVDYTEDKFECGTCGRKLLPPLFICSIMTDEGNCSFCTRSMRRKK